MHLLVEICIRQLDDVGLSTIQVLPAAAAASPAPSLGPAPLYRM